VVATHAGITIDEFERIGKEWFASAKHPRFNRPYSDMAFHPMVELLDHLRANGFRSGKLRYELRDGVPVIVRLPELDFFDDKEGKPAAIQKFIGQRPNAAFGNSDGDLQMLQWTAAGAGRRLMMLVDHTDVTREYDYRVSPMGRLEVARRSQPAWLDGDQHEGRLEADLRVRKFDLTNRYDSF
jgi:hypothetical protein